MKNKESEPQIETFTAVKWNAGVLMLLDQRKLPNEVVYLDYSSVLDVANAIKEMVVRGAPAIGITAAYAVVLAARSAYQNSPDNWREDIEEVLQVLVAARPTAINLKWAISKMRKQFNTINVASIGGFQSLFRYTGERVRTGLPERVRIFGC